MRKPIQFKYLPQVSLSKLYEDYNSERQCTISCDEIKGKAHDENIVIQSPFYYKNNKSKGPCQCAYHRMKRYKQLSIKITKQNNSKIKQQLQLYKTRIAAAIKASTQIKKQPQNQILQKNHKRLFRQTQKISRNNCSPLFQKLPKQKIKQDLDSYNQEFQQILRKRIQPVQDYQKVSNLIKYIKIRSKVQNSYLKGIRDYIYLRLANIVQKIKYEQLQNWKQNDDDKILKRIAIQINVKKSLAIQFMNGLQNAMQDMKKYLNQKSLSKSTTDNKNNNISLTLPISIKVIQQNKTNKNLDQTQQKITNILIDRDSLETAKKNQIFEDNNKQNERILQLNTQNNNNKSMLGTQKKIIKILQQDPIIQINKISKVTNNEQILIKSNRYVNCIKKSRLSNSKYNKEQNNNVNHNQFQNNIIPKQQTKIIESYDSSKNKTYNQSMGFETVKFRGQSIQKQHLSFTKNCQQINQNKKKNNQKSGNNLQFKNIGRATDTEVYKNIKKQQFQNKKTYNSKVKKKQNVFDTIQYQQLMGKQVFQHIKQVLTDQNIYIQQNQRISRLFQILEESLNPQDPQSLQNFIRIFNKVLTPTQITKLRKMKQQKNYRKMVQRLTYEADDCILKLKDYQQLIWRQQVDDRPEILKQSLIKFINLQQIIKNEGLFQEISKFKVLQKPEQIKKIEQIAIEQKQIGQLQIQNIIPHQQNVHLLLLGKQKLANKSNLQLNRRQNKNNVLMEEKQKQILRYMKKYRPHTFNQIKENIKDVLEINNTSNQNSMSSI